MLRKIPPKEGAMKYQIRNANITAAAYDYLVRADSPTYDPENVKVVYDRVYNLHPLDLRMLIGQFGLMVKELND